ncbi:MAG: hypothetical protein QOE01_1669, partial [Actinomycetota bacterium]|nr:hypothetical protein [Actinomycetota bacterium]
LWRANRGGTAVIKDPFALLALNGLQARVTRGPALVTIRHPCSWILSLRRVGWPAEPELESLRGRFDLAARYFPDLLSGRGDGEVDDIETGALAWTCLYQAVLGQVREGAQVVVIPMERLGRAGEETLALIFRAAGLDAPTNLAELARRYTGKDNSVTPTAGAVHLLRRNSAALSQAWRTQMSRRDQDRVREITQPVFDVFYSDWDRADGDIDELRG